MSFITKFFLYSECPLECPLLEFNSKIILHLFQMNNMSSMKLDLMPTVLDLVSLEKFFMLMVTMLFLPCDQYSSE